MLINHIDHAKYVHDFTSSRKQLEVSFQLLITLPRFLLAALFIVC